jgi:hypothetical protein
MKPGRRTFLGGMFVLVALLLSGQPGGAQALPDQTKTIAEEAYLYGYSLITTEVTRVQMTNVPAIDMKGLRMPMGQFLNVPRYPPADFRGVSAPNADTLYSMAWLDLGNEPIVFSHPNMGKRYFLFPMYSLWMPVIESPWKLWTHIGFSSRSRSSTTATMDDGDRDLEDPCTAT